jgi:dienelactone hydrolase
MNAVGTDYQLIVYGGAMHGFTHDLGMQGHGVAYHPVSDKRSFQAIKAFLAEVLDTEVVSADAEELDV